MAARMLKLKITVAVTLLLAGCTSFSDRRAAEEQGRRVAAGGIYKIGTPYEIEGDWYYPQEDTTYDNTGMASWYGPKFHGRRTANGEIFDMYEVSAAHKSLPIPSFLKVTNLDNNRSIVVRVNDRGPFHGDRIIDLSYAAAVKLDYAARGTARVELEAIVVKGDAHRERMEQLQLARVGGGKIANQ